MEWAMVFLVVAVLVGFVYLVVKLVRSAGRRPPGP
jgi:Na+-transporting methylmalonyl-CoA/oxaloacetate decarboxylase gamma subunit